MVERLATLVGLYGLLGLGYQIVFGQLGALNLAQGALFGVGAYVTALTASRLGPVALLLAPLAAALVAALAAPPILRLRAHSFALATLALASLINLAAVNVESLTGGANGLMGFGGALPRGTLLMVLVWLALGAAVAAYAAVFRGTMGDKAHLLREAPLVAASVGIDAARWRFVAFVIGGAAAGLAGGFSAALTGVVSPEATGFAGMLLCLTAVVLGGTRHPLGAVLGSALVVLLPELFRSFQEGWLLAYAAATLAVIVWAPQGLAGLWTGRQTMAPEERVPPIIAPPSDAHRLTVSGVSKRFGGVEALKDVSLTLDRGEIVGLIGPNGSGKTTLLNTISGLYAADRGTIALDGVHLERLAAHQVARCGIGRTFQTPLAGESREWAFIRALAGGAAFLLLDEPAAGMSERERAELAGRLRELGRDRGIIVVDHDIELLTGVCDRLVCLDGGTVIAAGAPAAVRADRKVRASFLGAPP
jgi:branched-chain amino acid transport system permease protein